MADFDFRIKRESPASDDGNAPQIDPESIMLGAQPETPSQQEIASVEPAAGPVSGASIETESEAPKRRGRPRKADKAQESVDAAMANFFSPDGIGRLWVDGWDAFFHFCGAAQLDTDSKAFHASVFATWAKHRLPQTPEKYQPDMMLLASIGMMALPRMQPIAVKTAPMWKRAGTASLNLIRRILRRGK